VHVRRITPDDAAALRAIRLAALSDTPTAFGSTHARELAFTDDVWRERAVAGSAGNDRATYFAVDDDGTIVGIAGGFRDDEDGRLDLVSMWTSPAVRRRGVGRKLVRAVLDWAGDEPVRLGVTAGNDAAIELYRAMGFVETGEVTPHPWSPDHTELVMVARQLQMDEPSEHSPPMS
jgi:ribosomal protein S18 acetylase RimI-like enzyme